jgi:predicted DNA-binding transcriptional regulator AlpA
VQPDECDVELMATNHQSEIDVTDKTIPPGASVSSIPRVAQRLCRSRSWTWDKIKNDPDFPKTIRLGADCVLLDFEVDDWLRRQVEKSRAA